MGLVLSLLSLLAAIPVHCYEYAYDRGGNRTYARVKQATISGTAHDNDRSYLYSYDDLQRLILAHMGKLATDGSGNLILDANGHPSIVEEHPDVALRRKLEGRQLGSTLDS